MADVLYLLSSLPYIDISTLDGVSVHTTQQASFPITIADFIEYLDALDESKALDAKLAVLSPKESPLSISRIWSEYEYSIRNELAKKRWAQKRSGHYHSYFLHDEVPVTLEAIELLSFVNKETNPYLREKEILLTKWQILENLDALYQFKLENIIIYGWKLQIYYSYRSLTVERGKEHWNTLVTKLAKKSGFAISAISGGF